MTSRVESPPDLQRAEQARRRAEIVRRLERELPALEAKSRDDLTAAAAADEASRRAHDQARRSKLAELQFRNAADYELAAIDAELRSSASPEIDRVTRVLRERFDLARRPLNPSPAERAEIPRLCAALRRLEELHHFAGDPTAELEELCRIGRAVQ